MKNDKIRSAKHLKFVRSQGCCITDGRGENCNGESIHAHHLTHLGGRAMSSKPCDSETVPLCNLHHMTLHGIGERSFWRGWGIDPELIADDLAVKSPCDSIKKSIRRSYD